MSRVPILLLFTVWALSAPGHAQSLTRTSRSIKMNLSHISTLNRNVVAADFNGDGIVDLAASEISEPVTISPAGSAAPSVPAAPPVSPTLPAGNVSSVSPEPAGGSSLSAVDRTAVTSTLPAGSTSSTAVLPAATPASAPAPIVAVFGSGPSVPNGGAAQPFGAAAPVNSVPSSSFVSTDSPAAASAPGSNVAVFGAGVTVPNSTAPVAAAGSVPTSTTNTNPVASSATLGPGTVSVAPGGSEPGLVVVLLGRGDGTFRPPIRSWISGDVLTAGDFNGDKHMDLVIAQPDNQVLLLQGKGDGTFLAAFPVDASIAVQTRTAQSGSAQPAPAPSSAAPATSGGAAPAVSAGAQAANRAAASGSQTSSVLIAGGTSAAGATPSSGTTALPESSATASALSGATAGVAFAVADDLDGDSRLDLVIGSIPDGTMIFRGLGDFTFDAPVQLVTGASPNDGAVSDLNGDGKKDIIVANRAGQSISIFLNQGGLVFAASDTPIDRHANAVAAGDVDRDGKADLVLAATSGGDGETLFEDGFAYVLLGRGDGTFAQPTPFQVPAGAWRVALGDFNHDGTVDIATANRSGLTDQIAALTQQTGAAASSGSDTVSILPGNGDGTFGTATVLQLRDRTNQTDNRFVASIRSLEVADVNRDQTADLVVSGGAILTSRVSATPAAASR